MEFPTELKSVEGAETLYNWFGYWPRFHDAEVISLHLNRSGASSLVLHTWEMTKEVDERGCYVLAKNAVVEIVMKDVAGLNIRGFNQQNVIFGFEIEKTDEAFRLTLDDCYGISGTIDAKDISIRLTPGKPTTSV
jgi:Immunity protein 50